MLTQQGPGLKGRANLAAARPGGASVFFGRSYLGLRSVRRCGGDLAPPQAATARPVRGFLHCMHAAYRCNLGCGRRLRCSTRERFVVFLRTFECLAKLFPF